VGAFLYLILVVAKLDPNGTNPEDVGRSENCTVRCNRAVILAGHMNEFTRQAGTHSGIRPVDKI